jgi:hypothetical protein
MNKPKKPGRPKGSGMKDPALVRVNVSVRLPRYMVDWLRKESFGAGAVIEAALEFTYGLQPSPTYGCLALKKLPSQALSQRKSD